MKEGKRKRVPKSFTLEKDGESWVVVATTVCPCGESLA